MFQSVFQSVFPTSIISLVPSQTELLHYLGLRDEVVGITKFCVHPPEWFQSKPRIGGTKTLNFEKIAALQPDLILGNKEENERAQIEELQRNYRVWISDVANLPEALDMIGEVGQLTGKVEQARMLVKDIETAFQTLSENTTKPRRAAYFIWRKPYMVAAGGTFIHDMMQRAGFENVFGHLQRYPEIGLDALVDAAPEVILLSSEPYPFAEKHMAAFREVCPQARIQIVDGEMFSWYGSRLLRAPAYFHQLQEMLKIA